jgi:hypothetical protein
MSPMCPHIGTCQEPVKAVWGYDWGF